MGEGPRTDTIDSAVGAERLEQHPHLFLVLQARRPLASSVRWSLVGVDECHVGRLHDGERRVARFYRQNAKLVLDVRVPDSGMSGTHARIARTPGAWILEDAGSKNGTRVNGEKTSRATLSDGDVIEIGHTFFLFRLLLPVRSEDPPETDAAEVAPRAHGLATLIPTLARDFDRLAQVARSGASVVLGGESGTGKEVVARAVHELSGRGGPFLPVNCGAIAPSIVESELFGHRRGAFSGAVEDRPGLVRAAGGGTLFLDEIGELPPPVQVRLLRVLQEHEVLPLGETKPVPVDVRIVAATNRSLPALVDSGQFRADLLARLAGFQLELPPLRHRREDLGLIIASLLSALSPGRADVAFDIGAARALLSYDWPLNVRELEKCLETALVLSSDRAVRASDLPAAVRAAGEGSAGPPRAAADPEREEAARREQLRALLAQHGGNVSAVARALGKNEKQIRRWMDKYKLR